MKQGQVRFYHLRWFHDGSYMTHYTAPYEKGGITVAILPLEDGTMQFGTAWCSIHDRYCRRTGREKALANLESQPEDFDTEDYPLWFDGERCLRERLSSTLMLMTLCPPVRDRDNWWDENSPYRHHLGMVKFGYVTR